MNNKNTIVIIAVLVALLLIFFLVFMMRSSEEGAESVLDDINRECITAEEEKTVRGSSMSPVVEDGDVVQALFSYYMCNEVERGDVVLYRYSMERDPLIKSIRGLSGDSFSLSETENGWNILINESVLETSEGDPYLLSENRKEMLSLYERDYEGVIPDDAYLIMSNVSSGAMDSTRFGLVHKNDIVAKVFQ